MSVCVNQMIQEKGLNKFMRLVEKKTMLMQKQGNIVNTILGDKKSAATTTSLSSNKRLPQNVLFPMKKTSSSEKLSHSKEHEPLDLWSSILNQKTNNESSKLSVSYIVKSSKSCMSEKSLEICTESLGSETGSDGFRVEACDNEKEEVQISNYNYSYTKKSLKRCFPPPLPSLSFPSLQMRPHRDNGRLLLQAVSVTSRNNFLAERQDGRLVLTFASEDEEEKDCVEREDEDVKLIEQTPMLVPRLALTLVVFNAYEHYWRTKSLGNVALLPSHEQNNYLSLKKNNIISKVFQQNSNEPKELVVLRGKNGDDLVKNFKNFKDFRRSFMFSEPSCFAA